MPQTRRPFESQPRDLVFRTALFLFVAAVVLLEIGGASQLRHFPVSGIDTQNLVVRDVATDSPNYGRDIRPGDVIVAVDGQRIRNHIHYMHVVAGNSERRPQTYTLNRDGRLIERTVAYRAPQLTFRDVAFPFVALCFLLVGLWVYLRRPDAVGTLFAVNCTLLAFFLTHHPATGHPGLQLAGELMHDALILVFPATLLHFFFLFPGRPATAASGTPGRRGRRAALLYGPAVTIYAASAAVAVRRFEGQAPGPEVVPALLLVSSVYFTTYILASLVTFAHRYRRSAPAQKQRLRVVTAGAVVGFLPFILTTVLRNVDAGRTGSVETASALGLVLVPATFAYAILKHGAIELNAVVRKSIVYAALTGAIIAAYYLFVQVVGSFMVEEIGMSTSVLTPVAAVLLAMLFAPAREQIQRVVDRVFYRGEYVYKQEVGEFTRQLARKLTREEIYDALVDRCTSLLGPSFIAVYAADEGPQLRLERSDGSSPPLPPVFPLDCFLGRYFTRYRRPLLVEFLDRAWERPHLDAASRGVLALDGLAVCVPVSAPDAFLGLLLLGGKRSGAAYRRTDADLLATFAEHLGLVLQNALLVESSLERERLKNEVMLARDIQLSLLPATPPTRPSLELRGQMVSSFEVGGDYFDFVDLGPDRVGVAIGDVSGKGIPAAMLMSSIQAVFTNLAVKSGLGPADVNRELNEYLCGYAKRDQFATFFYGIFDLARGTLTFSNAGHCPVLLATADYTDRLTQGGMVLGVRADQAYCEGTVAVSEGDVLLLYTDGVTEQCDIQDHEYGEGRLIAFLEANRNLSPQDLQNALIEDVLGFSGGRQDDDVTVLIARRTAA